MSSELNPAIMLFGKPEAAKLAGLSIRQLDAWKTELVRPTGYFYSFRDLVGLRTLKKLKDLGASTQALKKASAYLKERADQPWSNLRLGVCPGRGKSRREVCYLDPDGQQWIGAVSAQVQGAFAVEQVVKELSREVIQARTRPVEAYGQFDRTRNVCSNQWRFRGTRIAVHLVLDDMRGGRTDSELLEDYPTLRQKDLTEARAILSGARKLSAA